MRSGDYIEKYGDVEVSRDGCDNVFRCHLNLVFKSRMSLRLEGQSAMGVYVMK
jgi:hypothetical protein